jgi:hypothetical protein
MPFRMPQIGGTPPQDAVETGAHLRRLDLFGVPGADRRDLLRVVDAALEEADLPPELELLDREQVPRQIEPRQPRGLEEALIGEVVDRQDAGRAADDGMPGVERLEVHRREPGLPVVRVDDRRRARRAANSSAHAQHREAERAVRVIDVRFGMQAGAIVKLWTVHQQRPRAVGERRPKKPTSPVKPPIDTRGGHQRARVDARYSDRERHQPFSRASARGSAPSTSARPPVSRTAPLPIRSSAPGSDGGVGGAAGVFFLRGDAERRARRHAINDVAQSGRPIRRAERPPRPREPSPREVVELKQLKLTQPERPRDRRAGVALWTCSGGAVARAAAVDQAEADWLKSQQAAAPLVGSRTFRSMV